MVLLVTSDRDLDAPDHAGSINHARRAGNVVGAQVRAHLAPPEQAVR